MHTEKLRFQKWDFAAVVGILCLAALVFALFLPKGDDAGVRAEIYLDGALIQTVSLAVDQEFTVSGDYCNTVAVRDGKIAVVASDCPGEDCVHCGWTDSAGKSIICLPNGLEIRVVSDHSDVDFVVG